ncbi:unnamed protein product [Mytilus coruscus]|uniref:Ig-like domain-containing protein n=1 Tax=Mytilus coruscus TaxID=42192 RepID=A0A6J8CQV1_MYTCO|nr:unnamed protein product [Mytilus coruscus]
MLNLPFKVINRGIRCKFENAQTLFIHGTYYAKERSLVLNQAFIEILILNVTASDTGVYWFYDSIRLSAWDSPKNNVTCSDVLSKQGCNFGASSRTLTFLIDGTVFQSAIDVNAYRRSKSRRVSDFTIQVYLSIYHLFLELGHYIRCYSYELRRKIKLQEAKLWFIRQRDTNAIVGQEGKRLKIKCFSDRVQKITELKLESNGTIISTGDHTSVSYSFMPDRRDHLTKYKCTQSYLMIEVTLVIRYAPAVTVRYTNETIECDCDGVPAIYNVYRLDQISKWGRIVRSVDLNNGTFTFHKFPFPYQRNGKYMCVVSNSIPNKNGKVRQTRSTNVIYAGPPVFAPENKHIKTGGIGQSITLSFIIYSHPNVEDISIEKIGQNQTNSKKIQKINIMKSTLLFTEFDNIVGIEGNEILIESDLLSTDDFQAYRITVKNRLGESSYRFEIIDIDTIQNPSQNPTEQHADDISTEIDLQSTDANTTELNAEILDNGLLQRDVTELQGQHMSISSDDSSLSNTDLSLIPPTAIVGSENIPNFNQIDNSKNQESSSDQKSQTSSDSDSDISNHVMVGNVGDGYEHVYQTMKQDYADSHQYTAITTESHNSISSSESNKSEEQSIQKNLAKEAIYINLQF